MLPTPDTSHVDYGRVYEPAEDSFLLLDTLSSDSERVFLHDRFGGGGPAIFVLEVGSGSGVVIGFVAAQSPTLFGGGGNERASGEERRDHVPSVLCAGVDLNRFACRATTETVQRAVADAADGKSAEWLGCVQGDLISPWRPGCVDVLIFNPPYVPTSTLPRREEGGVGAVLAREGQETSFDEDSFLLELSYAGGRDGMETTDRLIEEIPSILSPRGCAYLLLCAQNRPDEVKGGICGWGSGWRAETVGSSGRKAGWEKLQIIRIWRET